MDKKPLNIAIIQAPLVWADKKANLQYFSTEFRKFDRQVDLVVLPEMFATGFITDPALISEKMDGPVMNWMKESAVGMNCVITGSITVEENGLYYNRLIWMRPDGSYDKYDKRHLFRMGEEHQRFSQGKDIITVEINGWKVRPLICYDLRFPVWSKNRYQNDGYEYDILVYVANWPASRSFAWRTLLSARAIENQSYCVGVNRIGNDGKGIPHCGGSVILDYKGKLLTGCEDNAPETVIHALDYEALTHFRDNFKVGLDWDSFSLALD